MSQRPVTPPKYRHYKPKDLAVVRIDGRDHYLGKYGSPESRERYHRLLAEHATTPLVAGTPDPQGPRRARPGVSVAEVILAYWKYAEGHYRRPDGSPTEEMGNIKAALRPLRTLYGSAPAAEFGPLALQAVRDRMIADGLMRTTINNRVNRIRRAFKWAASVEMVPAQVHLSLATLAGLRQGRTAALEPKPIGPVAREIVEATLPFLSGPVAAMVRLQSLTGMRPGEVFAMRGRDVTPGEPTWTYRPSSHKSAWRGKGRAVPLGPRAREIIVGFLKPDREAFLFDPREAVAAHQAARGASRRSRLTPSERSARAILPGAGHSPGYNRSSYLNAVNRACDRAFPHPSLAKVRPKDLSAADQAELLAWRKSHRWRPNQLRHAAATEIRARFGLEAAQTVLGHAKADVTQVYAERDLAKAREVMAVIG